MKIMHKKTGEVKVLGPQEYERFFDNRDPSDWIKV